MEDNIDDFVKKLGFESAKEFHSLMVNVDLSSPDKLKAFKDWKENDGSKEGLLKLPQRDWFDYIC